jgi:hypothetical protein
VLLKKLSYIIFLSNILFPISVQANKFTKVAVTIVAVPVCLVGGAVVGGVKGAAKGAAKGAYKGFNLMRKPKPKPKAKPLSTSFNFLTKVLKNAPYQFLPAL